MNNFLQYELWIDCNNHCSFCFNKEQKDVDKVITLTNILNSIDKDIEGFNEIGLIGGEFFDTQLNNEEVKSLFYKLIDKIIDYIKEGKVTKVYVTTGLLYKDGTELCEFLNYINSKECIDKFMLCTSYDTIGRFHTEESKQLWENYMLLLYNLYPKLLLHTEIIMTGDFIDRVLSNEFNISNFEKKYNCGIDFIQPNSGFYYKDKEEMNKVIPNFFPKRKQFLDFLNKVIVTDKTVNINRIFNRNLQSDTINMIINGKMIRITNRRKQLTKLPCDNVKTSCYIDSDISMNEDIEMFKGLINE